MKKRRNDLNYAVVVCSVWFIICPGLANDLFAQRNVSASVFTNAIALPGTPMLSPINPGADLGLTFGYKESRRHERLFQAKVGFYYQRLVHTGLQLYTEYTYRYQVIKTLSIDGNIGIGALMTVLDTELFRQNNTGSYEKTSKTRLHGQLSAALGLVYGRRTNRLRPFIQYRMRLFTPFVTSYVPLAPCTSVHIGTFFRLKP